MYDQAVRRRASSFGVEIQISLGRVVVQGLTFFCCCLATLEPTRSSVRRDGGEMRHSFGIIA